MQPLNINKEAWYMPWYAYLLMAIFIPVYVVVWSADWIISKTCKIGIHKWRILWRKPHGYEGYVRVKRECLKCGLVEEKEL